MVRALILAGGLGTRLRETVSDVPKPMAPISGRPFLERLMDYWIDQGVGEFILSVGYLKEKIIHHFGDHYRNTPIRYAAESEPLGTGGGLILGLDLVEDDDPLLILNGDTFFAVNLAELLAFSRTNEADWCLALCRKKDTMRYMGLVLEPNRRIVSLGKSCEPGDGTDRSNADNGLVNGGVYLIAPNKLRGKYPSGTALSLEQTILADALVEGQRIYGLPCEGRFIDIGVPVDYQRAYGVIT